jgi:biopolymer transport protein ExbB
MHDRGQGMTRWRGWALGALVLLLLQGVACTPALAWWNSDWSHRMRIVADAGPKGANITELIGRTQILIRLHSGNFDFATAKDDGSDLRVIAGDDRTPLHFHLERFDGLVDLVGLLWVDVPDLAPGVATPIYLYWGNANANSGADSHATYDADQLLVYHFADDNGLPKDATGYGNNALTPGKRDPAGLIGNGIRFDGHSSIRLPQSPSLAITAGQALTWSLWIRPDSAAAPAVLYSEQDGANGLTIGLDQGGIAYAQVTTADGVKRTSPGQPIAPDAWHLLTMTATPDHITILVDAQPRGDVAAALPPLAAAALLGAPAPPAATTPPAAATPDASPAAGQAAAPAAPPATAATPATPPATDQTAATAPGFAGLVDELDIAKVVRPAGTLQVAMASQGPDAKLLTFDVAEQASFFGSGYVGIIIRSVTPDAWAVIGLLGVMSLASWWVMIGKAIYLGGVGRANARFRAEYARATAAATGPTRASLVAIPPDRAAALKASPLFRLYLVGAQEVAQRLDSGMTDRNGMLAPQSLIAIRAAIDAGVARETQRLGRLMVLLTIAISGGPFLGLLGTVVGVMITFAAIAQAGDVNVNAIAPGISAALLATVAGLFVAIPALFGYNYLLTRIRDASIDMNAFVDQFVARMGEGVRAPQAQAAD